ncbi:MAG TPA: hypothetical protein VGA66_14025 [Mycobacterium sp.]
MPTTRQFFTPLIAAAGAAAAILAAPAASAEMLPLLPQCVNTGGAAALGGSTTICESPGNAQISSTPPVYAGPWGNMWAEPGYFFP